MNKYVGSVDGWVMRVFTSRKEATQWAASRPEATVKVVKDKEKERLLEELRNTPDAVF